MSKMNNCFFSIIVPVYNAEQYLQRCLDSIYSQTFKEWECILVNDGSSDNSADICNKYVQKDSRFRVLTKKNGGVSSARNLGIDNACGKWITFVDADDYLKNTFLELSVDADLLVKGYTIFGHVNKHVCLSDEFYDADFFCDMLIRNRKNYSFRAPWAKFFNLDIIRDNEIKFPLDMRTGEDEYFVLSYLKHCKNVHIIAVNEYLYYVPLRINAKYILSEAEYFVYLNHFMYVYEELETAIKCSLQVLKDEKKEQLFGRYIEYLKQCSLQKFKESISLFNATHIYNLKRASKLFIYFSVRYPYFMFFLIKIKSFIKFILVKIKNFLN